MKRNKVSVEIYIKHNACIECYKYHPKDRMGFSGNYNIIDIVRDLYYVFSGDYKKEQQMKSKLGISIKLFLERKLKYS